MKKKILVVEDEPVMAEVLVDSLEDEGYDVQHADHGEEGLKLWKQWEPGLVLLDVMLPRIDGFEICAKMREAGSATPVMFLSAKGRPDERVKGLSVGGDDYLTKPFHLPELLLRVRALLARRAAALETEIAPLCFGGHQIDPRRGEARLANGHIVQLQANEVKLLQFFFAHPNEDISRDQLLDGVWADDVFPSTRMIEHLVERLKELFEDPPESPQFFFKLPGTHFRFSPQGELP